MSILQPSEHRPRLTSLNTEISDTGYITYIGLASQAESAQKIAQASSDLVVTPKGSFLIPTFCDLHLHAPQFLYQGTGLHLPLMKWLDEYAFKAEERVDTDPALAHKVYTRLAQRLVEHGTGAVLLFGTIKEESKYAVALVAIALIKLSV